MNETSTVQLDVHQGWVVLTPLRLELVGPPSEYEPQAFNIRAAHIDGRWRIVDPSTLPVDYETSLVPEPAPSERAAWMRYLDSVADLIREIEESSRKHQNELREHIEYAKGRLVDLTPPSTPRQMALDARA